MKNKKGILFIIIVLILALGLWTGAFFLNKSYTRVENTSKDNVEKEKEETPPEKKGNGKPLLYKVTKKNSENVMYLFGSIHVADERAYPMPDAVMKAYNSSDALIVEFDLVAYSKDLKKQMTDMQLMVCDPGKTLKDYLTPEVYEKTIKYMKDNKIYYSAYESYKPAMIYSLVSNVSVDKSGLDSNKGIDMYFLRQAHNDKKEIIELETSTSQTETLLSFSDDFYNYLLDSIISNEEQEIEGVKKLYESWLTGDVDAILEEEESEDDDLPEGLEDDFEQYNEAMMGVRNKEMINKTKQNFDAGKNIFLVVGAAHIIGDEGIAKVLETDGYTVEKVDY